ncbi:hypothetical protein D3C83_289760 [compost metagenome]
MGVNRVRPGGRITLAKLGIRMKHVAAAKYDGLFLAGFRSLPFERLHVAIN